jgi:hypothetical protein
MPTTQRHGTRGWVVARIGDQLICADANQHSCHNFSLVTSEKAFQPPNLQMATAEINKILDLVRHDDRTLVLLDTGLVDAQGGHALLLAYVKDRELKPHQIRGRVDFDTAPDAQAIVDGLGLKTDQLKLAS